MKLSRIILFALSFVFFLNAVGQITPSKLLEKAQKKAEKKIENKIDNGIDNGLDKAEQKIENKVTGEGEEDKKVEDKTTDKQEEKAVTEESSKVSSPNVTWSKFDFVPGDKVIFEDIPSINEENGEFPSRWDLVDGQVEIMNVDGQNVVGFLSGSPEIVPYIKNAEKDYLPDVFTIEFDIYRPANGNRFFFYLFDRKKQRFNAGKIEDIEINLDRVDVGGVTSSYDSKKSNENGNWMHVSMAYTKGKFKVYLDDTRIINIPHFEGDPSGVAIKCYWADNKDNQTWYLKNFRIAEGGVKYYDRAMQDGKIVCTGIRFDVNKATLKPESMGSINEIYQLMSKNPDLKFSVEGHTDSDGDDAANQKLSEDRAKAVMNKLVEMGISASRLTSKGFGESKPIAGNDTPEDKAQNRRVEFVKF